MSGGTNLNSRRLLSLILGLLVIAGISFAAIPFIASLKQPAGVGEGFPQIKLSELRPGTYLWVPSRVRSPIADEILVIRRIDGRVQAYEIPKWEGKFMMPDLKWERMGGLCADFRPETRDGVIYAGGVIRCHDPELSEFAVEEWRWTYDGKMLGRYTADLQAVGFDRDGDFLRFGL